MTVHPLRFLGDPVLRTRCEPVTRFDDSLARLVADLLETVQEPGRAGLAANQIGSTLAVFAFNVDAHVGYLINPEIIEVSGDTEGLEACLSLPDVTAVRRRAARAVATGVDLRQDPRTVAGDGELARCLQHETDHLRGELFIDKLDGGERRRVMRQIRREWPPASTSWPAPGAGRTDAPHLAPGGWRRLSSCSPRPMRYPRAECGDGQRIRTPAGGTS